MPFLRLSLLSCVLVVSSVVNAAANDARWFRYYDDKKQATVTDSVTPEHVSHGYDELNASMQVIRHVAAQRTPTPEEAAAAKAKQQADAQRAKDDKQLLRMYSTPAGAEQARKRQATALQLRIDTATASLNALKDRRATEAKRAADFERKGRPVPADIKEGIARIDQQIVSAQAELAHQQAEKAAVEANFEPIIKRLEELKGKPASGTSTTP